MLIKKGKMDNTQRIIVVLLVIAILFSAVSIMVSYSAINFDVPKKSVSGEVSGAFGSGGVQFFVEEPPLGVENG